MAVLDITNFLGKVEQHWRKATKHGIIHKLLAVSGTLLCCSAACCHIFRFYLALPPYFPAANNYSQYHHEWSRTKGDSGVDATTSFDP